MPHQCPITTCPVTIDEDRKITCLHHWRLLPLALQQAVYHAYRRSPTSDEYTQAKDRAIRAIEAVIARRSHDVTNY